MGALVLIFIVNLAVPGSPGLAANTDPLTPGPGINVPGTTETIDEIGPPPFTPNPLNIG